MVLVPARNWIAVSASSTIHPQKMKPKNITTLRLIKSIGRSSSRLALLLIPLVFACFALCPMAQAVSPPPDGGYPGQNTAEGEDALFSLTTGQFNTAIYVIGDSLSSVNSGGYPGYYGEGTSNGPMWPEYLSGMLGIEFVASNDVAIGGAATFDTVNDNGDPLPGVDQQIASLPAGDKANAVVVLWLGTNDMLYVFSGYPAQEMIAQGVGNIQHGIEQLYGLGFRTIIVPNVFDLARTPAYRSIYTSTELADQRALIKNFNNQLAAMVATEQAQYPDAKIRRVNVFTRWNHVLAYAGNYGILYPYGVGMEDANYVATGDFSFGNSYSSWDGLHPTTTIHRLLAKWFNAAIAH
jgi:lysophospholipase L1-like esterase